MADIIETVPFNFADIYAKIEEKFDTLGYDIEEGSNTAQLITAMAYLTSMLNVNTAVNINETLLPLAVKRNNILQDARVLGYEIQHKQSYLYRLTLSFNAGSYIIPKYTKFTIGDYSYYYMGNQIDLNNVDDGFTVELNVKQGTLYKFSDYPDTLVVTTTNITDEYGNLIPQYFVDIPFVDVEENGIEIFMTYIDEYGTLYNREFWERSKLFMIDKDTVLNKQYIRIDNIEERTPRIYFSLSNIGNTIRAGTVVEINVLTTDSTYGGIIDLSDLAAVSNPIEGSSVIYITLLNQGADEESSESIKTNAPLFHNSANRAITKFDYETICNRHQSIKTSLVWGGDEEYPKSPGHIWFSFLPSTNIRNHTADSYNYNFILDNNGDFSWDYSLSYDSEEYTAQNTIANSFYENWFLEDNEIRSFEYNSEGIRIDSGVWDILDNYKIPTLSFHNRHPLYLDFEYEIQLLKYNIKTSKSDIYQEVFDVINSAFMGTYDNLKYESFESEYFDSSLHKRIDENITDLSGFTSSLITKLLITQKNISAENGYSKNTFYPGYRDLFLQLQVPYEKYFDNDGFLLYNMLPSIDTNNFIEYFGETGQNLYTDWSEIQNDISNGTSQNSLPVIIAPIRVHQEETVKVTSIYQQVIEFSTLDIYPKYPEDDEPDYSNVKITYNSEELILNDQNFGYEIGVDGEYNRIKLLGISPNIDDEVTVSIERHAGKYQLFNSYKKVIIIQLFIDATNYTEDAAVYEDYDSPKSYLTTIDAFYDFTNDDFYLTTEGYAITNESDANVITGPIVRDVTTEFYTQSPIKMSLFKKCRYLNFKYPTSNFLLTKNIIPRLKRVTFLQGV